MRDKCDYGHAWFMQPVWLPAADAPQQKNNTYRTGRNDLLWMMTLPKFLLCSRHRSAAEEATEGGQQRETQHSISSNDWLKGFAVLCFERDTTQLFVTLLPNSVEGSS